MVHAFVGLFLLGTVLACGAESRSVASSATLVCLWVCYLAGLDTTKKLLVWLRLGSYSLKPIR